jgi:hypothetical protein
MQENIIKAAAVVGRMRTTNLKAKIREKILKSEQSQGMIHMRKIDAIRQARVFLVPIVVTKIQILDTLPPNAKKCSPEIY